MNPAAHAYAKAAQASLSPRDLEAQILMRAAARLQVIQDDWANQKDALDEALTHNRRVWTVLVTAATEASNPLPTPIKQNIANLGVFILNHTIRTMADPAPEKLSSLVTINRELAAGLRGMPAAA